MCGAGEVEGGVGVGTLALLLLVLLVLLVLLFLLRFLAPPGRF